MFYQNILLDSGASASIVHKDILYKCHKILKDKMIQESTMAGTFNTTFVTNNINNPGIKSLCTNLRKMPFDG